MSVDEDGFVGHQEDVRVLLPGCVVDECQAQVQLVRGWGSTKNNRIKLANLFSRIVSTGQLLRPALLSATFCAITASVCLAGLILCVGGVAGLVQGAGRASDGRSLLVLFIPLTLELLVL